MEDNRGLGCLLVLVVLAVAILGGVQFNRKMSEWKALRSNVQTAAAEAKLANQRIGKLEARLARLEAAPRPAPTTAAPAP